MNSDQIRLQISSKINGFMTKQNLGMGEAGERRNHLIACIQEAVDGLLAAILQPQPAPLPEDAIETALAVYDAHFDALAGSYFPHKVRLAGMAEVLRNFAQRPDVLGPITEEERTAPEKPNVRISDWAMMRLNKILTDRLNRLFAPREPSLEEELTKILAPFIGNSHAVPRAVKSILALIQRQQGKGKE